MVSVSVSQPISEVLHDILCRRLGREDQINCQSITPELAIEKNQTKQPASPPELPKLNNKSVIHLFILLSLMSAAEFCSYCWWPVCAS